MGCVQAKETACSPPQKPTLERLKLENGYVRVENVSRPSRDFSKAVDGGGGGERKISRESERKHGGGNVSQRISVKKIVAVDETVDGWPRWLVENVKGDVLAGLVPKSADSYDKLAKVGQGTYSNVYKAREKSSGKIVALKKVRLDTSEAESVKFMAREIIMLKKLDHPNIIKLQGIATSRMHYSLYLVFDFMPSDLTKLISGTLTQPQSYMQQLLLGLQHCHDKGILHRDIKGSNLLIDKDGVLKIADFGLANFYNNNKNKKPRPLTSRVVTLWYRAPELLLGATDYGVAIDLWSAGCLLAEMFLGRPIMPGRNEIEQLHKIFKLCGSPTEDYWKTVKPPATFRPPQQYKANLEEAFPHFPPSVFPLLGMLLSLHPRNRGTAAAALKNDFFTASPLPCEPSGLPMICTDENGAIQSTDRRRNSNAKKQSQNNHGTHRRKVSFSGFLGELDACAKEEMDMAQSLGTGTTSSSSTSKTGGDRDIPPRSPTPAAFRSLHDRAAKTEAHPNALKNIKNYPLLLASLTEAANHLKESNSGLYRRSISHIDFTDLDLEKISKLFGLEDDN
ncbi:Protein kinase superfamily protein [Perilla frutescens var. frutescens]|nr:Protein kinase superfamily protein [Perilla frutescens var. frutescens]